MDYQYTVDGESRPQFRFKGGVSNGALNLQIEDHQSGKKFSALFHWSSVQTGGWVEGTVSPHKSGYRVTLRLIKTSFTLVIKITDPEGRVHQTKTSLREVVVVRFR